MTERPFIIHHYSFPAGGQLREAVPPGTRVLCVAMRQHVPTLYVMKPQNSASFVRLEAFIVGTGHTFIGGALDYVGTVTEDGFFWHAFAKVGVE